MREVAWGLCHPGTAAARFSLRFPEGLRPLLRPSAAILRVIPSDDGGEAMDVRELLVAGEDASGLGVGGDALDWGSDVAMGDLGNI